MPKKIAGGIPTSSLQHSSTQNDPSVTPPLAEQSSTSQAAGQFSMQARQAKEKGKAGEMRRRFYEEKRAEDKAKADGWKTKLTTDVIAPLNSLVENFLEAQKPLISESRDLLDKLTNHQIKDPDDQESEPQQQLQRLMQRIAKFDDVRFDFDKKVEEAHSEALLVVKSFDALPKADKDSFYSANDKLKWAVDIAKKAFISCKNQKMIALLEKADMWNTRILGEYKLSSSKYETLETSSTNYSGAIHKDVEEAIAGFDKAAQLSMEVAKERSKDIESIDNALLDPFLVEFPDKNRDIEKIATDARFKNLVPYAMGMSCAKGKSHLLIKLVMLDNKEQQGNENLKKWHALAKSFITQEYAVAKSVSYRLTLEERKVAHTTGALSREEVQIRLEAAREGRSQFEKAIRTCEKTIEGYEKLEGIVKDDRMTSSLQELKTTMTSFAQAREFAVQFWTDKLQEFQDQSGSFLPAHLQLKSSQKKADKTSSSQRSSEQPESSRQPGFHRTMEGVVFGCINENNELNGLDENGKVIATYFEDRDNSKWVKDYGDQAELDQPAAPTVVPVAPDKTTAVREKINRIVQKADNIAKASQRFSQKKLAEIAASSDYGDKFNSLNLAYSGKFKAILALQSLLVDLEFELKEPQDQNLPGEKLIAELKGHLARLQKEKQELGGQVAKAKENLDHHSYKRRDPTGATFELLREQGQVASIKKEFNRRQSRNNADDWLDRYVISFVQGAQGEEYEPWIVHAHYNSDAVSAAPVRVHMKRNAEKDWGVEQQAYHSPSLSQGTFNLVKKEAQKQDAPSTSAKKGHKKRR